MDDRDRRGFGLVELVVALGVGVVSMALAAPALQEAREVARRAECVRNLKQIGLATQNYVSVCGTLPMSAVFGPGHGNGQGCFTLILPFLPELAVYNGYNFWLEYWDQSNATSVREKINVFICPENRDVATVAASDIRTHRGNAIPGKSAFGPSRFGANWGGVREASGAEAVRAYPGSHLGVMLTVVDPAAKEKTRTFAMADITDGAAFTLAYAEKRASFGWAVGGWGGTEFDVGPTPAYMGDDIKLKRAFAGSLHPGGINAAFCDGSVRFLASDLERRAWHAMTTRAGGEVFAFEP